MKLSEQHKAGKFYAFKKHVGGRTFYFPDCSRDEAEKRATLVCAVAETERSLYRIARQPGVNSRQGLKRSILAPLR
jgi:hypothetical protein